MGIFSIFSTTKKENNAIKDLDFFLSELKLLGRMDLADRERLEMGKELNKEVGKYFFKAVLNSDDMGIKKILDNPFVSLDQFIDDKGYNIVEYCLFNSKNEAFKNLYNIYYDNVAVYFLKIPQLFTIILNKKNLDLIEFFMKNKKLADGMTKENVVNCLFLLIQGGRKDLIDLLIENFDKYLDARNIEASMIYSISNNQQNELNIIFSYPKLIDKLSNENVEKLVMFAVINRNVFALENMVKNKLFLGAMENSPRDLIRSVAKIAYDSRNENIMMAIVGSNVLRNTVDGMTKIEKY